jgi:hypothetical protein
MGDGDRARGRRRGDRRRRVGAALRAAVVGDTRRPAPGDWVHILHATLRRKARCDAAGEQTTPVSTEDLRAEAVRFQQTASRLASPKPGTYV